MADGVSQTMSTLPSSLQPESQFHLAQIYVHLNIPPDSLAARGWLCDPALAYEI